jgi:serine protease AprX
MKSLFPGTVRARKIGWQIFSLCVVLAMVLAALGATALPVSASKKAPKADPRLLQMAADNPDAIFMVIVQREVKNKNLNEDDPEAEVVNGGGQVKKQLKMIQSFSAEMTGKKILKLAEKKKVRWISADAPMLSTAAGTGMETMRDEFAAISYSGNNGTTAWSSDWVLSGGSTSLTTGLIQVVSSSNCSGGSGNCLRIDPYIPTGTSIYRQTNLSGMVSVWLSFYRNNQLNLNKGGASEQVQLQISPDGGKSWTTLQTYAGKSNTGAANDSFDISTYATANTQIRFLIPTYQSGARYIYFDDIEIAFARPSAFLSAVKADQLGLDGQGVTVAVVDSGLSTNNDDFNSAGVSRIIAENSFGNQGSTKDLYGHGTHVAGILGGNGAASAEMYRGVAPGVNLVNLRVSDKDGATYESNVIDSLLWIYQNKDVYNIRVVNVSLNSTVAQSYQTSALDAAVEILWLNGIVVVVSAGNNGTGKGPVSVYPPANDPFVITVGATEDKGTASLEDDKLAVFSAYSTTEDGFAKPELVAPGRNVVAPLSDKASSVYTAHPYHRVGDSYFRMSGTSMSAPMVSGAAALLLQNDPKLNPDQVKFRLMATSNQKWPGYDASQSGAGCLNVYSAVNGTTTQNANQDIMVSPMLSTGSDPITWGSVGWNSVGWNSVGWNSVGWNSVGWNSVGWNSSNWDD